MLPDLSCDAWGHIAQFLTPKDLHCLSLTCRTIYEVVTSEYQFRLRVGIDKGEVRRQRWSLMYRRFSALRNAPDAIARIGRVDSADGYITIVGSAGDTIIFYDGARKLLAGFPAGWMLPVAECLDSHCVLVGMHDLAIMHCSGETLTHLECVNIQDGSQKSFVEVSKPVNVSLQFSKGRVRRAVFALSAGKNGDHLVFVREKTATVVRLADGCVVQVWDLRSGLRNGSDDDEGFAQLVRGEDGGWCAGEGDGGERVVGVVQRRETFSDGRKKYEVLGIEDGSSIWSFCTLEQEQLVDVVVSRDQRWIARRIVKEGRRGIVWGSGFEDDGTRCEIRNDIGWSSGTFGIASCEFALGRGGREMRVAPIGLREIAGVEGDGRVSRVWCGGEGVRVETLKGVRRVLGRAFDWATVSGDGRTLIASCRSVGVVSIFGLEDGRCMQSLSCGESIDELCLVGHHWLVTIASRGLVRAWHFGRWCRREGTASSEKCSASQDTDEDNEFGEFGTCCNLFHKWDALFPCSS